MSPILLLLCICWGQIPVHCLCDGDTNVQTAQSVWLLFSSFCLSQPKGCSSASDDFLIDILQRIILCFICRHQRVKKPIKISILLIMHHRLCPRNLWSRFRKLICKNGYCNLELCIFSASTKTQIQEPISPQALRPIYFSKLLRQVASRPVRRPTRMSWLVQAGGQDFYMQMTTVDAVWNLCDKKDQEENFSNVLLSVSKYKPAEKLLRSRVRTMGQIVVAAMAGVSSKKG